MKFDRKTDGQSLTVFLVFGGIIFKIVILSSIKL